MEKYTKRNSRQILSGNAQDHEQEAKSQAGQLIDSETPAVLGKTSRMTDSLENLIKARRYDAAFRESSRLFQENGDILYLSTCLHIFSLGTGINGDELLALIDKCTGPLYRDYCLGIFHALKSQWPETFLQLQKTYLNCQFKPSLMRSEKTIPLCVIDRNSNGELAFEVIETTIYLAALYSAESIPRSLLEGMISRELLLGHKLHIFGSTNVNAIVAESSRLLEAIKSLHIELDKATSTKKRYADNHFPMPPGAGWGDIYMTILQDYVTVQIEVNGIRQEIHHTEMGFPPGRGNNPYGEWWKRMLQIVARGYLYAPSQNIRVDPHKNPSSIKDPDTGAPMETEIDEKGVIHSVVKVVKKGSNKEGAYLSSIKKTLQNYFSLKTSPFYKPGKGRYRPEFHIKYGSFEQESDDVT